MTKVDIPTKNSIALEPKDYDYAHCYHDLIDFSGSHPRCYNCGIEFDDYGNPILERE